MKFQNTMPTLIGRKPILEALQQGVAIEKIFMVRSATGPEISEIRKAAKLLNVPLSLAPAEKIDSLSKANHQGVVAWAALLNYVDLQSAISHVVERGQTLLFLVLDGVTDTRNVGAIARSALCCGAQAIVLPTSNSASITADAIKTSAGALNKIMLCRVPSVQQAIDIFKLNGIMVVGTFMKGSVPVYECQFSLPTAVVMGAEDTGISKDVIRRADTLIKIPMAADFDSLNVSVAAGIILYEAMRQRLLNK